MIIAIADTGGIRTGSGEESDVSFALQTVKRRNYWMVLGNVIVATSEAQLNKAIRSLPVNRMGDGLL